MMAVAAGVSIVVIGIIVIVGVVVIMAMAIVAFIVVVLAAHGGDPVFGKGRTGVPGGGAVFSALG